VKQENHAIAKMTARCAGMRPIWVPWKLYVSAKSADDCIRIATLHNLIIIRWWNYFRCVPTNVIRAPKRCRRTDR